MVDDRNHNTCIDKTVLSMLHGLACDSEAQIQLTELWILWGVSLVSPRETFKMNQSCYKIKNQVTVLMKW